MKFSVRFTLQEVNSPTASPSLMAIPVVLAVTLCGLVFSANTLASPVQVGTNTQDAKLPAAPVLPTASQVCVTLEASNRLVARPDGALPPEADPSVPGVGVAADPASVNPDQARIQAALDSCGAAIDKEVGAAIADADSTARAAQQAAAVRGKNIAGASGEELAKPQYRGAKFAVRLVVSSNGPGNAFISGPLKLPSGVTLWIDKGVTLFGTRDVMAYAPAQAGPYCGNTAVSSTKAGGSSNCIPLLSGNYLVNAALMGEGAIDGRGYAEIVTTNKLYPLMKVDMSCSNTYAAYANGVQAADGTACDNGGNLVNSKSTVRNMSWWDLAYLANLVQSGTTGFAGQSVPRIMVFNYAKNLTVFGITLNNSPGYHMVPSGVDGLTVWGVKLQTPSLAAFANPAGNGNPLYTGEHPSKENIKNTDAFDPGSAGSPATAKLSIGSQVTSAEPVSFDGYLKNVVFAYNYISSGDDDIVLKGGSNPSPAGSGLVAIDGERDVRSDRKWGVIIAHNHIYFGHGISVGSETYGGVRNVHIYDNSFDNSEEGLRIKSDNARGGEVSNIYYDDICIRDTENALLFTPYYGTRAIPAVGPLIPNFHDIYLNNVSIQGATTVRLQGYKGVQGNPRMPATPLAISLTNVATALPEKINVIASDANIVLNNVNLPVFSSAERRIVVKGTAHRDISVADQIDCSKAFPDFPSLTSPAGTTWQ